MNEMPEGAGEVRLELLADGTARLKVDDRIMNADLAILIARLIDTEAEVLREGRWSLISAITRGVL